MSVVLRDAGQALYSEDVSADNTVAAADSGIVLNQVADGKVTTLPDITAALVGTVVIVRIGGVQQTNGPAGASTGNGQVGHSISPHSSDKISGLGAAGTANKDLLMVKADGNVGDYVVLVAGDVIAGVWNVVEAKGSWTREA